jgi:hypothetical protein
MMAAAAERLIEADDARRALRQAIVDRTAALEQQRAHDLRVSAANAAVAKCRGALRRLKESDPFGTEPPIPTKELRARTEAAEKALRDATDDLDDLRRGVGPFNSMRLEGYWVRERVQAVLRQSPEAAALRARWDVLSAEMSRLRPVISYLFGEPALSCVWDDSLVSRWRQVAAVLEVDADAQLPKLPGAA